MRDPVTVMIVDDHPTLLEALAEYLRDHDFEVRTAAGGREALRVLETEAVDIAFLDMVMPEMSGMDLLSRIRERWEIPVVMFTGFAEAGSAVEAIERGAYEFLTKPVAPEALPVLIQNALEHRRLAAAESRREGELLGMGRVLGESAAMREVLARVRELAGTEAPVLLTGETGTGKNLLAREIHAHSPRRAGPYHPLNCTAISPSLFESELFGHERGSFTGAVARHRGHLERSHRGTLLLDEIGSLPLELQGKLLAILEESEFERVGGDRSIRSDVRVLAATNMDLREEVAAGRFRRDLFYRLCAFPIHLPPLRERRGDIPLLITRFLSDLAEERGVGVPGISEAALAEARAHPWPGNVRELKNAVRFAVVMSQGEEIASVLPPADVQLPVPAGADPLAAMSEMTWKDAQEAFQDHYFRSVLEECGGDRSAAAARAGVDRRTIQRFLARSREQGGEGVASMPRGSPG